MKTTTNSLRKIRTRGYEKEHSKNLRKFLKIGMNLSQSLKKKKEQYKGKKKKKNKKQKEPVLEFKHSRN